jgi:hypothetical protein
MLALTTYRKSPDSGSCAWKPKPVAIGDRVRVCTRTDVGRSGTVVGLRPTAYGEPEAEIRVDGSGEVVHLFQTAVFGYENPGPDRLKPSTNRIIPRNIDT